VMSRRDPVVGVVYVSWGFLELGWGDRVHLLKVCVQILISSRLGWDGISRTRASSFAVGIQNASLPLSTSVVAAKSMRSSSMASKL